MPIEIAGHTRIGQRAENQDRYGWRSAGERAWLALADGMGGHARGELAAEVAVESVLDALERALAPIERAGAVLVEAVAGAHRAVVEAGARCDPPADARTTLVVAWIDAARVRWAHVGDSRLYWFQQGRLAFRTRDHNAAETLYAQGRISARERRSHPARNWVDRCLGGEPDPPEVELGPEVTWSAGDRLLLCSDGLTVLDDAAITEYACAPQPLAECAERLTAAAEQAAAPYSDNVTVVLCERRAGEQA